MNEHVVIMVPTADAYHVDFVAWAAGQARLLRDRRFDAIDIDNLAEEIEELARSDEREAINRLKRIVEHLLKLQASADENPRQKWLSSINFQRDDLDVIFSRSPSLRARRDELFPEAWSRGMKLAQFELRDDPAALAQLKLMENSSPSFSIDDALNPDFWP